MIPQVWRCISNRPHPAGKECDCWETWYRLGLDESEAKLKAERNRAKNNKRPHCKRCGAGAEWIAT